MNNQFSEFVGHDEIRRIFSSYSQGISQDMSFPTIQFVGKKVLKIIRYDLLRKYEALFMSKFSIIVLICAKFQLTNFLNSQDMIKFVGYFLRRVFRRIFLSYDPISSNSQEKSLKIIKYDFLRKSKALSVPITSNFPNFDLTEILMHFKLNISVVCVKNLVEHTLFLSRYITR